MKKAGPLHKVDGRDVAERVLRREAAIIPALRTSVIESESPEAVHDLRVCVRRVRTAIRVFEPVLGSTLTDLAEPLRGLFGMLGLVRDFDVAISSLGERPAPEPEIVERLNELRRGVKASLVAALERSGPLDDLERSTHRLTAYREERLDCGNVIVDMHRKTDVSFRKLRKEWNVPELHRLRRQLKRLRYTVEFFEPHIGSAATEYISHLKKLQDGIGEEMDRITLAALLARAGPLSAAAETSRREMLLELEVAIDDHRKDFVLAKKALTGKAWKALADRL